MGLVYSWIYKKLGDYQNNQYKETNNVYWFIYNEGKLIWIQKENLVFTIDDDAIIILLFYNFGSLYEKY